MMYGNSSMGYGYSPDRSRDVSFDNYHSQFLYASGNRQNGYYYSGASTYGQRPSSTGWYDGAGRYHKD